MRKTGISAFSTLLVFVAGVIVVSSLGLLDVSWPWEGKIASTETVVFQRQEAKIVEIEPIALDCRARIHAQVPIEGRKKHKVLGQTYRTDKVRMEAVGDIDTCVESDAVEVWRGDEVIRVTVPARSIKFVRPRVDAIATMDSVRFSKGWVGKLTDVFPWVSENSGLTPAAYAYAQSVIGSSDCMEQAYEVTTRAMTDAYRSQLEGAGGDPDDITVEITGAPNFDEAVDDTDLGDFDFEVAGVGTLCSVDPGAYTVPFEEADVAP